MEYIFTFLEGIASFISPCLLPMLPIYISYFVGEDNKKTNKALINSIGFVLGFTIVFLILSIFASKIGNIIIEKMNYIEIIFGIVVILLGLSYIGVLKFNFLNKTKGMNYNINNFNFFKAIIFGMLFSITWTPCIGTFLSSALLLIATNQNMIKGIALMLLYSLGIGIPFIISVILIEKLKIMFDIIKKNYNIVKAISGIILILMGIYIIL